MSVRIIPVLDLKDGQVVRASGGRRDSYRPIVTPLAASSEPVDVASGLRTLYPFDAFYCADLDAIAGKAPNIAALQALHQMPAPPTLWVDAGIAEGSQLDALLSDPLCQAVIGTESQRDTALMTHFAGHARVILSLDFFADGFHGPTELLENTELWPATVIVMTLERVGSAAGPDLERLTAVKSQAGSRQIVAAGGVRNAADAARLSALGINAALVATSLHDGTLTPEQLASLQG